MDQIITEGAQSISKSVLGNKVKRKKEKRSKKSSKDKTYRRKHSKKRSRKRRASSSSDFSSSSSSSSFSSESSEDKKIKKPKKKKKKKSKAKKAKDELEASNLRAAIQEIPVPNPSKPALDVNVGPHIDLNSSKKRAPMTREEYEKQQNTLKWIVDPETGRRRLIRGSGEIMEEIVSRERHQAINKQATIADGNFFQAQANLKARSSYD